MKAVQLLEQINTYDIILASKSPRRQQLLHELGIKYRIVTDIETDETYPQGLDRHEIPVYLAKSKAEHYRGVLTEKSVLITADTIVWFRDTIMPKPSDPGEAKIMLRQLSGQMHEVYTGVNIISVTKETGFYSGTRVYFRDLSDSEIGYYVDTFMPLDKAGAYGIQEWIGYVGIERIEGSFYNVMGLPVQQLYQELIKLLLLS